MEDISSQSMSEAEVYWNCDSPTPTTWQQYQAPSSVDAPSQKKTSSLENTHGQNHKKVKTSLFNLDEKSLETARSFIREFNKFHNDAVSNSLECLFERSGNGETLAASASTIAMTKNDLEESGMWVDDFIDDDCILQTANKIQSTETTVSTSTPLRSKKEPAFAKNEEGCLNFFMSSKHPLKNKLPFAEKKSTNYFLQNASISDEVLSQLLADDSWVESCSNSTFGTKQSNVQRNDRTVTSSTKRCTKTVIPTHINATHICADAQQLLQPFDRLEKSKLGKSSNHNGWSSPPSLKYLKHEISQSAGSCKASNTKNTKFIGISRNSERGRVSLQKSGMKLNKNKSTVEKKDIQKLNGSFKICKDESENLFSDDDEELLFAVMSSESQKKNTQLQTPETQFKNNRCSKEEIERKKQEAIKRRLRIANK